jgi:hypothetical protein
MRQPIQYQIILLLAPILASSAFTISSSRATASAWQGRNNRQLRQQSTVPERSSIQDPRTFASVNYPLDHQRRFCPPPSSLLSAASSDEASSVESESDNDIKSGDVEPGETAISPKWKRVLFFYKYNKDGSLKSDDKNDDGLSFKQKLAKMGLSVLLSYGFVSNMSYCVTVSLA